MEPFSDLRSRSSNVPTPTYYLPPPFPGGSARANTLHITTHRCEVQTQTQTYYSDLQENAVSAPFGPSPRDLSRLPPINQESPPAFGPSPGATSVAYRASPVAARVHPVLLAALAAKSVPAPGREPVLGGAQPTARRDLGRRHRPHRPPGEHC